MAESGFPVGRDGLSSALDPTIPPAMPPLTPAIFLDRDGTLMADTGYVGMVSDVRVFDGVREALAALKARGFLTVIVTNQSGIARGKFTLADYEAVHARFLALLGPGLIDATYMCAEHPDTAGDRRKPGPGMLLEAARDLGIDLTRSWMVGDRTTDLEAGRRAGVRSVLVLTGEDARDHSAQAEFVAKDFASAADFILKTADA
jgi:D,D-heptose 1,7-bisphosphate phosphatase